MAETMTCAICGDALAQRNVELYEVAERRVVGRLCQDCFTTVLVRRSEGCLWCGADPAYVCRLTVNDPAASARTRADRRPPRTFPFLCREHFARALGAGVPLYDLLGERTE